MRSSRTLCRMAVVCLALFLSLIALSCEQAVETITYKTDTLRIKDTLKIKDTIIQFDTLHDTTRIPIGTVPPYQLFGMLIDGLPGAEDTSTDSTCGFLALSSQPPMRSAIVNYGKHSLTYTANQNMITFFEAYNNSTRTFPMIASAQYEGYFRETAKTFPCSLMVPYYATDTSTSLSFDSLSESVTFPAQLDSLAFFDAQGTPYDSVDYNTVNFPNSIKLNSDLIVKWKNIGSDWYGIECFKLESFNERFFDFFDTFTVDTQMVIPHSLFYQDSLTDPAKQYDVLLVTVVPVSGPPPATWDSCVSFGGKGYLFALHYNNVYSALNTAWDQQTGAMAKRAGSGKVPPRPPSADVVTRLFGLRKM